MLAFDTDIHAQGRGHLDHRRRRETLGGLRLWNRGDQPGHNHPAVLEAAHRQLDNLVHAGCIVRYDSIVEAAERLRAITPPGIEKFSFANSGAEAVEAAVKLAKHTTGRQGVVVFRGAFHGRTMGALTYTTSNARYRDGYHPVLGSVFVTPTRTRIDGDIEDGNRSLLNELRMMFKHVVTPKNIACFLIEPVQGEGGYYPAPARFLDALREMADEHGIELLYDEVQSGFGRTAEWFASDHYDAKPDIMAMGKGIATASLSAYGSSREIIDAWPRGAHGTTYGGNPVSTAASVAVIETMEGCSRTPGSSPSGPSSDSTRWPTSPHDRRRPGPRPHDRVELVTDRESRTPDATAFNHVEKHAFERELIIINCGPDANVIRFIPPLITTREEPTGPSTWWMRA